MYHMFNSKLKFDLFWGSWGSWGSGSASIKAKSRKIGRTCLLLEGSHLRKDPVESFNKNQPIRHYRSALINSGFVVEEDNKYVLKKNILIDTASNAASIVCGSSKSGDTFWKLSFDEAHIDYYKDTLPNDYVVISKKAYILNGSLCFKDTIDQEFYEIKTQKENQISGYLYSAVNDEDNLIKIGLTREPDNREMHVSGYDSYRRKEHYFEYYPIYFADLEFMEIIAHSYFYHRKSHDPHYNAQEYFEIDYQKSDILLKNISVISSYFKSYRDLGLDNDFLWK